MNDKFPFAFDMASMTGAFKDNGFEKMFTAAQLDFTAMQDVYTKNMTALTQANNTALAGYQDILKRQQTLFEGAMSDARTRMADMQGQPATTETAIANFETMKSAFEQAVTDLKDVAEMVQATNTKAFGILKNRGEEVLAEMKAVTDKAVN